MSDYIKREDALNMDFRSSVRPFESRVKTAERAVQAYANEISKIPAADVRPVVRGMWIPLFSIRCDRPYCYECSSCGFATERRTNFCHNCGADMREANDGT